MAKILIVDDEPDVIRVVSRAVEGLGHVVVTARNGAQALDMLDRESADLVIVDLDLPQMNGLEVCKIIKRSKSIGHLPVMMMTAAYVSLVDAKRATSVGADEYLFKPFMTDTLIRNVQRLLASS